MPQMFARTGSDEFPTHLKLLVSGPPKSGKTTFLGTVPDIVIADTEPHANNLQSVAHLNLPFKSVRSSADLRDLHMVLKEDSLRQQAAESLGMDQIGAVAIDTLDTLQSLMKKERVAETRKDFLRDDWGWIKEEMTSILQAFTALPMHVIFVVHTKTKEIGQGDAARTIVLPGLEGSIDQAIAGMVGYSLLSFRKQELRPDGSAFTKYWLRAEGDENYEFVGNRAAGQLPDVIEPNFRELLKTVKSARDFAQRNAAQTPAPRPSVQLQRTESAPETAAPAPVAEPATPAPTEPPPAPAPAPVVEPVAQTPGQTEADPAQPSGTVATPPQQQHTVDPTPGTAGVAASAQGAPAAVPGADEPANPAAMMHVKRVYDALEMQFPEEIIAAMTMGECRKLVQMWMAVQQDHIQGKGAAGHTPQSEMREYLLSTGAVTDADGQRILDGEQKAAAAPAVEAPVPTAESTSDDVLAWVGQDVEKATWAWAQEKTRERPRTTLLGALERRGARPSGLGTGEQAPAQPPAAAQTPVENAEPSTGQAVAAVEATLGGSVISGDTGEGEKPCEVCGQPVDDLDIARLSQGRFNAWLCVKDYVARTRQPATAGA